MPNFFSKEQILATRNHRRTAIVDTPELGCSFILIALSGKERDSFEASLMLGSGKKQTVNLQNIRAKLVARSIVYPDDFDIEEHNGMAISARLKEDHEPRRIFNDLEANDLGEIDAGALQRLFKAAQELSGISEDEVQDMVTELKNDQNAGSGTG